jgi:hypothetical protein
LLAAGEHPKVVQELLGHSSVQLALDTYSHLLPDLKLKERAADRLDEVLRQTAVRTAVKSDEKLVSQDGVEPSTRRLRERLVPVRPRPDSILASAFPRFAY